MSITFHCQFCWAWVLSNLNAVCACVRQSHLSDVQFPVASFTANLKAFGGQDDGAALVPADAASGVGHGAVEDHPALLKGSLILQRFYDADGHLW